MYVYGYNALLEVAVPTLIVQEIPTYINAITATKQRKHRSSYFLPLHTSTHILDHTRTISTYE